MLTLRSKGNAIQPGATTPPRIFRLSADPDRPAPLRKQEGYIHRGGPLPTGFAWYLVIANELAEHNVGESWVVHLPSEFSYLGDGDVVRVSSETGDVHTLFQRHARHHSFMLTERCNHYCLMCSQPPRDVNDGWIVDDVMKTIPLIGRETQEILFSGGEPTLLRDQLVDLVRQSQAYLPETAVHILTNGRAFKDAGFAAQFAELKHHDLMFGIPIYSDQPDRHDYIVQADGAFDETVRGVLNLKRHGLRVEIRVVVHKQSYERLAQLARFIARNLTFVDQVVFMGLEMTGFTRANLDALWIDPLDYQPQLVEAVQFLADSRIHTSVYNHQLCITDRRIWEFARKSISDWKNEYMPECEGCAAQAICGGFFSSAKLKYSGNIRRLKASDLGM